MSTREVNPQELTCCLRIFFCSVQESEEYYDSLKEGKMARLHTLIQFTGRFYDFISSKYDHYLFKNNIMLIS